MMLWGDPWLDALACEVRPFWMLCFFGRRGCCTLEGRTAVDRITSSKTH